MAIGRWYVGNGKAEATATENHSQDLRAVFELRTLF